MLLEIKCPMKGKDSDLWEQVASDNIPDHYMAQVQHQLMVMKSYFDGEGIIHNVVQGSKEWKELRRNLKMASESPAVLNMSPFQTPAELMKIKQGEEEVVANFAMKRGSRLEPIARSFVEEKYERLFSPAVVEGKDLFGASLDGWDGGNDLVCRFSVYCESGDSIELDVEYDEFWVLQIKREWQSFWSSYLEGEELEEETHELMVGDDWSQVAEVWQTKKAELAEQKKIMEGIEKQLKAAEELMGGMSEKNARGAGVQMTRFTRKGRVDYNRFFKEKKEELEKAGIAVDLDEYRGETTQQVKFTKENQ